MTMVGLAVIEAVAPPIGVSVDFWPLATAGFALLLVPLDLAPETALLLLAAALVAQVVYELARHEAAHAAL